MTDRLLDLHDALLFDLDGTVYRGGTPTPHAGRVIAEARELGVAIRYVTNNASRGPGEVADALTAMGVGASAAEVSTSAQAAATVLADLVPAGARVLVLGTAALAAEVGAVGRVAVPTAEGSGDRVDAVVQGLSRDLGWRDLAEACVAIRGGAVWIACNDDRTLPDERGLLPGNGAMVTALRAATGREPVVAGKPKRPLMDESVRAAGGERPLVVGDLLTTDIAGANEVGLPSLFVLSGVSTAVDLLAAPPALRPTHLGADLTALTEPAEALRIAAQPDWRVTSTDEGLVLHATTTGGDGHLAALRALCAAHHAALGGPVDVRPDGAAAAAALIRLGLAIG